MNKGEVRFIVVGKTGNGKSATCNSIAGRPDPPLFKQTASTTSVTKKCQYETLHFDGTPLVVVDTPGLFDTGFKQEETLTEIGKVMGLTSPGFHAFVIVVSASRFTEEEKQTVDLLAYKFGPELYERSVVLFTGVDNLKADGVSFEEYLKEIKQADLDNLIKKCSRRCVGFDNRLTGSDLHKQVESLIANIEKIMVEKKNTYYTNEIYEAVEACLKKESKRRMEKEKKSEENVREQLRKEIEKNDSQFSKTYQAEARGWGCSIL